MRRVLLLTLLASLWATPALAQTVVSPLNQVDALTVTTEADTAKLCLDATNKDTCLSRDAQDKLAFKGTDGNPVSIRNYYSLTGFTSWLPDTSGNIALRATTVLPGAPSAALAGAGAGSVDNGAHVYCVTFVTAGGETDCSGVSNTVTVADKTADGKVTVTFTVSPYGGVTGRNVYRSKAGTTSPLYLVAASPVVANNTATTYTDNIADSALQATQSPVVNTAIDARLTIGNNGALTLGTGAYLASGTQTQAGTGTAKGPSPIIWYRAASAAGACNTADAGPDTLYTITTIPANTLWDGTTGRRLSVTGNWAGANNADGKNLGVSVGGNQVNAASTTLQNQTGRFWIDVMAFDATHVNVTLTMGGTLELGKSWNLAVSNLTTNTLAVLVTGTSGSSAANDLCLNNIIAVIE